MKSAKSNGRKKFTQREEEIMFEFAQTVGWKLLKRDEELIRGFCSKNGVKKRLLKMWMRNKKDNSTNSTSDILPECLIQKILCYLSFKEATKMSILSNTWLQAWLTLPTLKFTSSYLESNTEIAVSIVERLRDGKIPIDNFELSEFGYSSEVFPLIDNCFDDALQKGVKELVFTGAKFTLYPFPIFKILATKSLTELVISDCSLKLSFRSGVTICNSLRKLSLTSVHLDENMLQTLLNSCPLIVSFILKCCSGLEKIELMNLQKIKSISISKARNQLVKIQAPTLESLSYSGHLSEELDVIECHNLNSLDLSHVTISNKFLQHLVLGSKSLSSLILVDVSYDSLKHHALNFMF